MPSPLSRVPGSGHSTRPPQGVAPACSGVKDGAGARVSLDLSVTSRAMLYRLWMPLIARGGLFVPTKRAFSLGEEVLLLLVLFDRPRRLPLECRVVWITPAGAGRIQGIGLQLPDSEIGRTVVGAITTILHSVPGDRPTFTL